MDRRNARRVLASNPACRGCPRSTHDLSQCSMFWGLIPGSVGETSTFCILLGAILLIATGIGSWKIMLSTFIGGYCMALLLNYTLPATNPYAAITPITHLIMEGFAFGAVFMATDPVTSAQTERRAMDIWFHFRYHGHPYSYAKPRLPGRNDVSHPVNLTPLLRLLTGLSFKVTSSAD